MFAVNGLVELEAFRGNVTRTGNHSPLLVPYGLFQGKSGNIITGALNPKLWTAVARTMGKLDLADDPRFNTIEARQKNRPAMIELIEEWLFTFENLDEAVDLLVNAGVPCGKVGDDDIFIARLMPLKSALQMSSISWGLYFVFIGCTP